MDDFIYEYKSLYICAVFDNKWKKIKNRNKEIEGEWTEENSFGTPDQSDETHKNPQYGLRVTKTCTIFINLTQKDAISALKGKNFIYLRVQRNNGTKMRKEDISSSKLCGNPLRPKDGVSLSTEIELEADSSYPYTFTIMACTRYVGDTGKYNLEIYCNDLQA